MSRLDVLDQLAPDENRGFPSNDSKRKVVLKWLKRILAQPSFIEVALAAQVIDERSGLPRILAAYSW